MSPQWEILSARLLMEGGCYSVTLAVDSDKQKAYVARWCADPRSDPVQSGINMSRDYGLGHAADLFEATEICNRDAVAYKKKPR